MKPIIVQKYGGSSVADVEKIRRVAERIIATKKKGYHVVAVVSAMGSSTDNLMAQARQVSGTPKKRELDMLLSVGERITMSLMCMAIQDMGFEAISFTGSQCGIITSHSHANARIIEVRPVRIQDELERDRIVIVAGFQGMSYKREVTTLGRGGSDTTAVAIAASLEAKYCEICSDVDGVYSGDPRVVAGTQKLDSLSYDEMAAIGKAGAEVLNPDAIEFARSRGMKIMLTSTFKDGKGTLLLERVEREDNGPIRAVALQRKIYHLRLKTETEAGLSQLVEILAEQQVPVERLSMQKREGRIEIFVHPDRLPNLKKLYSALIDVFSDDAVELDEIASVSLVGAAIAHHPRVLTRAELVFREKGLECLGFDMDHNRVTFYVSIDDASACADVLHGSFFSGKSDEVTENE